MAAAVFCWWIGTGIILMLDRRPGTTFRRTMIGMSVVSGGALVGLLALRDAQTPAAAYAAFACGLMVWAWSEASLLTGLVTGRRTDPCPPGARVGQRFVHGVESLIHHEIAIACGALAIALVSWNAPNQVGLWTYLALWALRTSAKLNLFLGVRNTGAEMLPPHLGYLASLFGMRAPNPLMPLSILGGLGAAWGILAGAFVDDASAFRRTGLSLVGALVLLGVIEHLFMLVPLRLSALWNGFARLDRERARP